ncbi:helix-turn-helix transcriptional regulator [Pontibacter chitinilyticus]|uniref:helix-turn-helix transcriptional regulator n=1 Tax=Pontibacter chitinilyticus TaxID=2674989 RepID=UPI00321BCA92
MDKILTENWANTFSQTAQRLVHSSERYTEVEASFEEPGLATGKLLMISTPGMVLSQVHLKAEKKLVLCDTEGKEEVRSSFLLHGDVESQFTSLKNPVSFLQKKHGFQYNPNFQAEHVLHTGEIKGVEVRFDLAYFRNLVQCSDTLALEKVCHSIERKEAFLAPPALLDLQPRMAEIIYAIQHCSFQGFTRYLFMEAKLLELFALQVEHMAALAPQPYKAQWSPADKEKLRATREFIEQNYLAPLSLAQLTKAFGLNEFKLKKGYKQLFGTTVFGHILHLRMQEARLLLAEKKMNVSEVADHIGYNNIGSFSAAFKQRFGYSPGTCRT